MFDTLEEIRRQLEVKEDARAEFKEVKLGKRGVRSPNTEEMAGEMVAFANAEGGVVFLGVDDDGVVRGLPPDRVRDVEAWAINVASNNCDPPIRPILRREQLAGPDGSDRLVVLVQVRRGLYVHGTSGGRYHVRVGSTKQLLKGGALARLFQERGRTFVFDEQPVPTATMDDLDRDDMSAFFATRPPKIPWQDLLRNTRVAAAEDALVERPTVAGLLAFGTRPQAHLPSAYVEAAVYRGRRLTSDDLVHAESIHGQSRDQIDDSVEFVDRFMLRPARKVAGRTDHPQYNIGAVPRSSRQRGRTPRLLAGWREDPALPLRRQNGTLQPGRTPQHADDRDDALPGLHPQSASGEFSIAHDEPPNGSCFP